METGVRKKKGEIRVVKFQVGGAIPPPPPHTHTHTHTLGVHYACSPLPRGGGGI